MKTELDQVKPMDNIVKIDEEKIQSHLDSVVKDTVEETLNGLLDVHCSYNRGKYNNVINIKHPAYCIYVSESPASWTNYDHIHPETWGSLKQVKGQVDWDRHNETSNYLFVDGHAENLKVEQTWSWPGQCLWFPNSAPSWPPEQ